MVALGASALWQPAALAECRKWVAQVTECEAVPSQCNPGWPAHPSDAQRKMYYDVLYSETPVGACQDWARYTYGFTRADRVHADLVDDVEYDCWFDFDGDQLDDDGYNSFTTYDAIQREACCEYVPNGPHSSMIPDVWVDENGGRHDPADGLPFTNPGTAGPGTLSLRLS